MASKYIGCWEAEDADQFSWRAHTVTGSQHLPEINGHRLLLDCGLYQGRRGETYNSRRARPRGRGLAALPADRGHAPPDRRRGARGDEADGDPRQHGPRPGRRPGGARRRAARRDDRRRRARRDRSRADARRRPAARRTGRDRAPAHRLGDARRARADGRARRRQPARGARRRADAEPRRRTRPQN